MPSARIVFEVKLEGTARKVVTVRSALVLNNQLEDPVELKMEKSECRWYQAIGHQKLGAHFNSVLDIKQHSQMVLLCEKDAKKGESRKIEICLK